MLKTSKRRSLFQVYPQDRSLNLIMQSQSTESSYPTSSSYESLDNSSTFINESDVNERSFTSQTTTSEKLFHSLDYLQIPCRIYTCTKFIQKSISYRIFTMFCWRMSYDWRLVILWWRTYHVHSYCGWTTVDSFSSQSPFQSLVSSLQLPSQQWVIQQQGDDATAVCKIAQSGTSTSRRYTLSNLINRGVYLWSVSREHVEDEVTTLQWSSFVKIHVLPLYECKAQLRTHSWEL